MDDFPLPPEPYLPGRSPRPSDDDDVHRIGRAAPDPTDPAQWAGNPAWMAGLRLYAAGYFWEAHEVWEKVWMHARPNSRERLLVQGVIQLANAGLKQRLGQPRAARRLAELAAGLVHDAAAGGPAHLMGLDPPRLARSARNYADALSGSPDQPVPALEIVT